MDSGVSRSAPALIPTLPDALVILEIVPKLGDALGPSSFFQLRKVNSGWRDAVNHSRRWKAFKTMKSDFYHIFQDSTVKRLLAWFSEERIEVGQPPPTTEMGKYYVYVRGLMDGHFPELEFTKAFELAAAGEETGSEEEIYEQRYWWAEDFRTELYESLGCLSSELH